MKKRQVFSMVLAMAFVLICCAGVKAYTGHEPIRIDSNNDFNAVATSGNGTEGNPWVIENYEIDGSQEGYCIYVGNTTDHFVIQNCYLHNASGYETTMYYENSGVILYNVQNGWIKDSKMACNYNGIYLYSSSNNIIEGNFVILNSYQGINLWHSSDSNLVYNNAVGMSGWFGIYVVGHEDLVGNICNEYNNISYNIAWHNYYGGLYLAMAQENVVFQNDLSNNEAYSYGFAMDFGTWNTISYNYISENDYGMYIGAYSDHNEIFQNQVQNNLEYGIFIQSSDYNTIYHNNIVNNTCQAYDDSTNDWTDGYPSGGNYWDDYSGTDEYSGEAQNESGADGIGDTPYLFDEDAQDQYPLMEPAEEDGLGRREDINGLGRREDIN